MNYLDTYSIFWQFTKEKTIPFRTQAEIINYILVPLINDKIFQERKIGFYITKIDLTDVRIAVSTTKANLEILQNIVNNHTNSLVLNSKDGWDGRLPENPGGLWGGESYYESPDSDFGEISFRKFLENIAKIGLNLHKKDLTTIVPFTVKSRFQAQPIGSLHPREILGSYFHEFSDHYRSLETNINELNEFWDSFSYYKKGATSWAHFYYNIILGLDTPSFMIGNDVYYYSCEQLLASVVESLARFKIVTVCPPSTSCEQKLVFIINSLLI